MQDQLQKFFAHLLQKTAKDKKLPLEMVTLMFLLKNSKEFKCVCSDDEISLSDDDIKTVFADQINWLVTPGLVRKKINTAIVTILTNLAARSGVEKQYVNVTMQSVNGEIGMKLRRGNSTVSLLTFSDIENSS